MQSAIAVGAKGMWLQSGVTSREAVRLTREADLDFVQDRCLKVDLIFNR